MFRGESTLTQKLRIGSRLIDQRSVLLSIISFLSILSMTFAVHTAYASTDDVSRTGKRVLTIYDDGIERGILTESSTLRDALDHADIDIGEYDITEPGLDDELTSAAYDVNIYRARPVAVHDGGIVKKIMTPYRSAAKIAKQANINLHDEDRVSLESSDDVVRDGAVERLVVERATGFTFVFYGEKSEAYTQAATVGEMLTEKDIALGDADKISVDLDEPIRAGMRIDLWREGKQTVTRKELVEFPVRQIEDADQKVGYRELKTAGVDGEKLVTYEIVVKNGEEISKKALKTVVLREAKEQVEVIGVKSVLPPGSHSDWMKAAGISEGDYGYVNYIVGREGGWCPYRWQGDPGCTNHGAVTPNGMGYGLVQATPGIKMASAGSDWLTNPITQLKWANGYAIGRYGSWQAAYQFWLANNHW